MDQQIQMKNQMTAQPDAYSLEKAIEKMPFFNTPSVNKSKKRTDSSEIFESPFLKQTLRKSQMLNFDAYLTDTTDKKQKGQQKVNQNDNQDNTLTAAKTKTRQVMSQKEEIKEEEYDSINANVNVSSFMQSKQQSMSEDASYSSPKPSTKPVNRKDKKDPSQFQAELEAVNQEQKNKIKKCYYQACRKLQLSLKSEGVFYYDSC